MKFELSKNMARISDQGKYTNLTLPVDVLSDLQDAFALLDKDGIDVISITAFKNILHNFGFAKLSLSDLASDLKRFDSEFGKRTGVDFDFLKTVVAYRWSRTGAKDECKDAFKVFDKRDRNVITKIEMGQVLNEYLDISKPELDEIYEYLDPHNQG